MVVTIHQPEHLPWLGYFNKMAKCDCFVLLDSVQFEKNYYQNRNKVIGTNQVQWIGVPVWNTGHMESQIKDIVIAEKINPKWKSKYLRTLEMSYEKHPYFSEVFPLIETILEKNHTLLCEMNIEIIKAVSSCLGFEPRWARSSEMQAVGSKSQLILNICKEAGADMYISGPSGREYLDIESFEKDGIKIKFNDYRHPIYEQRRTKEFVPYLSAVDLFFNHGFIAGKNILMKDNDSLSDK